MKKIAVMLFLSFLVGMVNATTMSFLSGEPSQVVQFASHSHCEDVAARASHDESQSTGKLSVSHYCCSAVAVLNNPISFVPLGISTFYLLGEISKPISNITESIYKPPRNYL